MSRADLKGSAERVGHAEEGPVFQQLPPPSLSLRLALKPAHQRARRPSASRPFIVPKLVKLKQFDV